MLSPRFISVALIFISSFIVDAFTVPATKVTSIPSSAANVLPQEIRRMTLASSNSGNSDDFNREDESVAASASLYDKVTTLIGKSASTLVSVSFFLLLSTKRDAITTTLFIGSILNAITGKILKKILNHDRPAELELNDKVKLKPSDGGMPSSHAMSLSFIGMVILFGVIVPATTATSSNNNVISITSGVLMVIYSAIALRYRVRDHLHTFDQIIVGYILGLVNAILWLKFAVVSNNSSGDGGVGPVVAIVQQYLISSETNQFPVVGLLVPILVGVLVVGSFERRIGVWLKERKEEGVVVDDDNKMK